MENSDWGIEMLRAENLCFKYQDGTEALRGIDFDSSKGNVIGVIGANGSGKSTFFMNMVGLLKPTSGRLLFHGKPVDYGKKGLAELRRCVNLVLQNPDHQLFYSEVYDDIAFALRNLKVPEGIVKEKVEEAIRAVDAESFAKKPVHFLSYGQKKRIAIATALVLDLEILLLDEPTAGLDPKSAENIRRILSELKKKRTIVVSSHDIDFIHDICDYLYVFSEGKIILEGGKEIFSETEKIRSASLTTPWLIEIEKKFHTRSFADREDFEQFQPK